MGRCGSLLSCRIAAAVAAAVLLAVCATSAVAGTPVKQGPPNAMASLGDSITRGFNACPFAGPYQDCPERSWSTGDGSVNSQFLRIRALNSAIGGRNYNNGRTGAKIDAMLNQAAAAGANPVKPELVTVLLGANDACTATEAAMTSVAAYGQRLNAGLDQISASMPDARIYVVSIPDIYELWNLGRGTFLESTIWNTANICQSMLANPGSTAPADQQRRERVRQRVAGYNAQIREACDVRPHCRHDDGRVFAARFNLNQVSNLDGFHPNEEGQKYLADVAWSGQFDYGDRTAPSAPVLTAGREPDGVDGWYSAPVAVRAASASTDTKGTEYALRSGAPAANPTSWTPGPGTAVNVGGTGVNELQVRAVDRAGNTSASSTLVVKVDDAAPTLTLTVPTPSGADGWHVTRPTVTVAAADATSGVDDTTCTVDDVAAPITAGKVAITQDGTLELRCVAADKAGNQTVRTATLKVDTTAPVLTLAQSPDGRNGFWRGDATITYEVASGGPAAVVCTAAGENVPVRPAAGSEGRRGELTLARTTNVLCTATDFAGRTDTRSLNVKVDRSAPTLAVDARDTAGADDLRTTSPYPFVVTATGATSLTCTAGGETLTVAQPPSVAAFETTVAVAGQGDVTLTCTDADDAGNETTVSRTVTVDSIVPVVTIEQQPDGRDGWWKGAATASASVEDTNPGTLACTVDGAEVEDAGDIAVTGDGTHAVVCTAIDRAGNSASQTATVKIDATAPGLRLSAAPDGDNGFFRTAPAAVGVTATGATEVACTVDGDNVEDVDALSVTGDGTHEVACVATDDAGNETTETETVQIDTAAPKVTIAQSPNGRAGWWTTTATATASVADANADALACTVDGDAAEDAENLVVTGDGSHEVVCTATDRAGNTASETATVKIDTAAPRITLASTPDGSAGWFRIDTARVAVASADADAEVACTVAGRAAVLDEGAVVVRGDGVREVACSATDQAGNSTSATHDVKIDTTAPAVPTASVDRAPEALGWHRDRVTVTWAAVPEAGEQASGIDPASVPDAQTVTADGGTDLRATVRDRAGNVSGEAGYRVQVDSVAPTAALTCPTGVLAANAIATAEVTADDASSGVVDVPARITLDTSAGGLREARLIVRDRVGHETVAACAYSVEAPVVPQPQPPAQPQPQPQGPATPPTTPPASSADSRAGATGLADGKSGKAGASKRRLTLTFTPKRPKAGRRLRVTVKLTPAPTSRPRVAIERRVKGKWRRVKVVRLARNGRATTTVTSVGGDKLRARLLK